MRTGGCSHEASVQAAGGFGSNAVSIGDSDDVVTVTYKLSVGDNADVGGAHNYGIDSCYFVPNEKEQDPYAKGLLPSYKINCLSELM